MATTASGGNWRASRLQRKIASQPDASIGRSCVMCGTPTRHGAYAVLSCPCNDGVTSSLAIEAPGVPAIQRRLVVCIIVVGELEVRINPGNLDARLAKRSFHIRTTNSRVRAKYVWCRGRLRTAEDRRARPGSVARCISGADAGALVRIDGGVAGFACLSDRPGRVVRTCKAGGCMRSLSQQAAIPPSFQTSKGYRSPKGSRRVDSSAAGPLHNAVLLLAANQTRIFSVACAMG